MVLTNKYVTHSSDFLVTTVTPTIGAVATTIDCVSYITVSTLIRIYGTKSKKGVCTISTVLVISDNADPNSSMLVAFSNNIESLSSTVWLKG
jgi:hypothetical protein